MRMTNRWRLTLAVLLALTLTAGTLLHAQAPTPDPATTAAPSRHQECPVTFAEFAYAVEPDRPALPTALGPEWIRDPISDQFQEAGYDVRALIAAREVEEGQELWFLSDGRVERMPVYIRFRPADGFWDVIRRELPDHSSAFRLHFLPDNQVWGRVRRSPLLTDDEVARPMLVRFDEALGRFELIEWGYRRSVVQATWFDLYSIILVDQSGIVWLLAIDDGIFRLDPNTQTMTRVDDAPPHWYLYATFAENSIYYVQYAALPFGSEMVGVLPSEESQLYRLNTDTLAVERIEGPPPTWAGPTGLLMDDLGRLWYGTTGYRTPEGVWTAVDPEVNSRIANSLPLYWLQLNLVDKTSDGRLWFRGRFAGQPEVQNSVGTAWLDPATGEGCAFIDQNIPLTEDTNGRLWTVVDGNVYYTDLNPR